MTGQNHGYCLLKKNLKSERFEYLTDANRQITIIKLFDNKCSQIILNFCCPKATTNAKQWDITRQTYIKIDFPTALQEYNKSMRGVHLADMLIPLYRLTIKTKGWYLKILIHFVDIAKANALFLYSRHFDLGKVFKKSHFSLVKFVVSVALPLATAQTVQSTRPVIKNQKTKVSKCNSSTSRSIRENCSLDRFSRGKKQMQELQNREKDVFVVKNVTFVCISVMHGIVFMIFSRNKQHLWQFLDFSVTFLLKLRFFCDLFEKKFKTDWQKEFWVIARPFSFIYSI